MQKERHTGKRFKDYKSASIRNKLLVQDILENNPDVEKHLLETKPFTEENLRQMTMKHPLIYVKPVRGSRGIGIFRIRSSSDEYTVRTLSQKKTFQDPHDMFNFLLSSTKRNMIIQKGIVLQKVKKRPFDIRVMVQRKPKGTWTCTGFFCKVGKPKSIVTNVFQGGELWTTKKIFNQQALPDKMKEYRLQALKILALNVAKTLGLYQTGMYQMGIDMAFDENEKLWILEVNSHHPAFYPMKKLNKSMYNRMMRFAKSYGRTKP